jgi:hypothetical protein
MVSPLRFELLRCLTAVRKAIGCATVVHLSPVLVICAYCRAQSMPKAGNQWRCVWEKRVCSAAGGAIYARVDASAGRGRDTNLPTAILADLVRGISAARSAISGFLRDALAHPPLAKQGQATRSGKPM